jgi:hypothetical protein
MELTYGDDDSRRGGDFQLHIPGGLHNLIWNVDLKHGLQERYAGGCELNPILYFDDPIRLCYDAGRTTLEKRCKESSLA